MFYHKKIGINLSFILIVIISMFILGCKGNDANTDEKVPVKAENTDELQKIADEVYTFAYPIILMEESKTVLTNVPNAGAYSAPLNQFTKTRKFFDDTFKNVVSPNSDTLYMGAYVDLEQEPYIVTIPDTGDRYYLAQFTDAWTDVFASIGTRTKGAKGGNYIITGPFWKGDIPEGVERVEAPTNLIWIIVRILSSGTEEDYSIVHKLEDQITLIPLSQWGNDYQIPKDLPVNKDIDPAVTPNERIASMDAETYYTTLANMIKKNPLRPEDKIMLEKLEKLGITSEGNFDYDKVSLEVKAALDNSVKTGFKRIEELAKQPQNLTNGWLIILNGGKFGTDYTGRAVTNYLLYGLNLPEDAVYPSTRIDSEGNKLNGSNKYILHFDKGKLPPVKAFWSLTMYDDQQHLVKNPLNRYAIGDRSNMKLNADGSLDIYLQKDSPGKDKESNWLPAPEGDFNVTLRLYTPDPSILNGEWVPSAIQKVNN